jgi:DNA-directed RNA polymerase III subunit RPC3
MNEDDASESKRMKKKRKYEDMENASSAILWRVNFEECNRRLYNSLAIDLFEKHVGGASRKVVEAILYADEQEAELSDGGVAPIMHDSSFVSQQDVLKASKEIHDVHLKASDIKEVLEACRDHDAGDAVLTAHGKSLPPLSSCIQTNGNIRFRTTEALRIARHLSLLAIIEQRFGSSARRVWNMLYLGGQMEQKAIATESMLHNGEAREVLYAMLRNGFVTLQDVPRNADRAPSRTFYTWRAPLDMATIRATIMLYRTANNLLSRMAHETSTNSELLRRVHLVNQGRMDASQLNASQLHKLKATVRITESALIDIESQIAIFS